MSHTAAPWCTMYSNAVIRGFDGTDVANIILKSDHKRDNARLIAAAPDLLAALVDLQSQIRSHHKMNVKKDYSLMVADAQANTAINKATGG